MDFDDSPEDRAFRQELRAWLAANHPGEPPGDPGGAFEFRRAWQRRMDEAGWAAPGWPLEWGGRGATVGGQVIVADELAAARAPVIVNAIGVWNIGPAILAFGTDEQKRRWLPAMLRADEIWCQGFSEPGAGSDLAAIATRAVRARDAYVVDGRKVWTSNAHRADRCFLLCRTGEGGRRHDGLSVLALDMRSPGVVCRPIREITGESGFDEVEITGARVPLADRIGAEGEGWRIAMETLTHERVGTVTYGIQLRQRLEALLRRPEAWPSEGDAARLLGQAIAERWIEIEIIRLTALRAVTKVRRGEPPWPEVPIGKMLWAAASQELAETAMRVLGPEGLRWVDDPRAPEAGRWAREEVHARMTTIGAGTTEVQKNVLAERALGLGRD